MTVENIPWNISVRNVTIDEKFYRSGSVLFILILALMQCKIWNRFFTILSWPSRPIDLKLLQVCQFMLHYNVLTLPATGLLLKKKQFCNVPFRKIMKSLCYYSFFFVPRTDLAPLDEQIILFEVPRPHKLYSEPTLTQKRSLYT